MCAASRMAKAKEHFVQFNPMRLTQPDQRQSNCRRHKAE
jgi:hypothetical protein